MRRWVLLSIALLAAAGLSIACGSSSPGAQPTGTQRRVQSAVKTIDAEVAAECGYPVDAYTKMPTSVDLCELVRNKPPTKEPEPTITPIRDVGAATVAAIKTAALANYQADVSSAQYVETTVGKARTFFALDQQDELIDTGEPAWAFVVYGKFQYFCMGCGGTTSPVYSARVVVIPTRIPGRISAVEDKTYDLTSLGTVHDVPASEISRMCGDHPARSGSGWACG